MDRRAGIQRIWEQQTGTLQPLGQITGSGGTAVTNASTSTPFAIPTGARLVLQLVAGTLPVAFVATPDPDSGAALTPSTTGPYPQFAALGQMISTCLFGGGGANTGFPQGGGSSSVAGVSVISAAAFTVNVYRLR
jgi:hypothetical protein